MDKCVRDVMKEKKIEQKDTGCVWKPLSVLTCLHVLPVAYPDAIFRPFNTSIEYEI